MPAPPIVPADAEAIAKAAQHLKDGDLVAFPTETVYGLGADAGNERAVAQIFQAKQRPAFNPLIVHVAGHEQARRYGRFDPTAERLADAFWPGALTLVLPRQADGGISDLISAGLDTVALRVPDHPVGQALLQAAALPIAAPSANRSGRISPTEPAHVAAEFADQVAMILDGGPCGIGLESTVVGFASERPLLLRPGGITAEALAEVVGPLATADPTTRQPSSPGQLASHYAPGHPLRINAREVTAGEALLAFGPEPLTGAAHTLNLSPSGDLVEAAANLFRMLRQLDRDSVAGIAVMTVPEKGLGRAINDRLRRAAA